MGLTMNIAKTKVIFVYNTPINVNNGLIENVECYVNLGHHYSLKEKNQDKEIQRRIMAGWAATARISSKATRVKRHVYNSCVLPAMPQWCRDLDIHQTSTQQTCGNKYAQHRIQGQKDQLLGQGEDKSHRHNQQCETNEVVLGRASKTADGPPVPHHFETTQQEQTTREISHAVERRPGQILKRHDLAEDSARQANLEMAC